MIKCVYCSDEEFDLGKGSEEHAILSSLGGKKISKNICCQKCNNHFGDEIDKYFSKSFEYISNIVGIKTGRNKSASTIKNAGVMNGHQFYLKPGGLPSFSKPIFLCQEKDDNTVQVDIRARDLNEANYLVKNLEKKYGRPLDSMSDIKIEVVTDYLREPTTINFEMGGELFFRSIAKMMLTYLATVCAPARLRDGATDEIINYIKGDTSARDSIILSYDYNSEFPSNQLTCKVSHLIFIWADPESKLVFCGLRLFGHMQFSAKLSSMWNGGEIKKCYQIDPICGEGIDIDIDFNSKSIRSIIENIGYNEASLEKAKLALKEDILELNQKVALNSTIDRAAEAQLARQELSNETLDNFAKAVLTDIQNQVIKQPSTEVLTLEQLKRLGK
ncbi:HNH endonuclease [Motilimonas sp. 1_MG-2023]|uniref:HNH endonuclease n=1 Tax=Motilimonas sp. 1_MG-2023 TaxID=3062672 RepID=UPI0026E3F307|nr:HNH endonuclease [Motilimonas sp. 1_MG-2023]MDO6525779.1 HNH endonuclease [Motilimonas sp. 1_MG-2023]